MEISGYDSLKRYWRRRPYQRLSNNKRKIRVVRLGGGEGGGGGSANGGRRRRIGIVIPKLRLKFISPIKLLAKFRDAYVAMMVRLAFSANNAKLFAGKKVARSGQQVSMAASGEQVDIKLVLDIYKRLAASRPEAIGAF